MCHQRTELLEWGTRIFLTEHETFENRKKTKGFMSDKQKHGVFKFEMNRKEKFCKVNLKNSSIIEELIDCGWGLF